MTSTNTTVKQFRAPRGCLSYALIDNESDQIALIDPSEEMTEVYKQFLVETNGTLTVIIETHTHADHVSCAPELRDQFGGVLIMHADSPSSRVDRRVSDGETITLGKTILHILHTPGHTNESISIHVEGNLFTGDALLISGTGRTDFQLGNSEDLYNSLWNKLMTLPDETIIWPAHDYQERSSITVAQAKETNPRLQMNHDAFIEHMNQHHPPKPERFDESIEKNSR